jgi:serine/threonine protein kinase
MIKIDDFDFLKPLGQGTFGAVYLVRKKTTKDLFALKIIDCSNKDISKYMESLRLEKNIFEVL